MKPRILVVDDEASIRVTLRMILEYEGYEVLQAATGEDGVRLIEREAPDLVFLDIKMPGMDGLVVLQKVRHLTDSTPIVVISGHVEQGGASSTEAVEAMKLGARDFIEKPPTQDRILVTVRNVLDTSRLRSENRSFKRDIEDPKTILDIAEAPDGKLFVSTSATHNSNANVKVWDVGPWRERTALVGHAHHVLWAQFSPDGQALATGSADCTVRLWNALTGKELRVLRHHRGAVLTVAFSPDGRRLASTGLDGTVKVLNLESGDPAWMAK